jgi:hypothetical protein
MATKKETGALVEVFERAYKYYKGWVFEFGYPGYFAYHQMGGSLSVFFTPDFSRKGSVDVEVHNDVGETVEVEDVPYVVPTHNGAPQSTVEAYALFLIVRPWLEKHGSW